MSFPCYWCKSRELGGRSSPRFPCVTPVEESFSSDLLWAIISYWVGLHLESCQTSYPSKHLSRHVLKTSSTRLQFNNSSSSKTSWRPLAKTSWRRLGRRKIVTLKTSRKRLEDPSWRRLEEVLKTCLEDFLRTCLEDVLKTCLENIFKTSWRQKKNGDICISQI